MKRMIISLPDALFDELRRMAAEQHVSMAALVREALEAKSLAFRPKPEGLGLFASGYTDTAQRTADELPVPLTWRDDGLYGQERDAPPLRRIAEEPRPYGADH